MGHTMTKTEIAKEFLSGRNCAQCVLGQFAEEAGYDRDETDRMMDCFGGGMEMGHTCGAVTGALAAIGLLTGNTMEARALSAEFRSRFEEENGFFLCRELLGLDVSKPEERAQMKMSGKFLDFCPGVVESALMILEGLID